MKDDVMIITGAAMGLGLAAAKELASKGARIALVDYNAESLESASTEIASAFPSAKTITITAEGRQASLTEYDVGVFRKVLDTNAIAPGAILTPMVAEAFKEVNPSDPKGAEAEYAKRNPTRRLGQPEDVAKVVAFLLGRDNGYVSGQTLAIDGGESNLYGNS